MPDLPPDEKAQEQFLPHEQDAAQHLDPAQHLSEQPLEQPLEQSSEQPSGWSGPLSDLVERVNAYLDVPISASTARLYLREAGRARRSGERRPYTEEDVQLLLRARAYKSVGMSLSTSSALAAVATSSAQQGATAFRASAGPGLMASSFSSTFSAGDLTVLGAADSPEDLLEGAALESDAPPVSEGMVQRLSEQVSAQSDSFAADALRDYLQRVDPNRTEADPASASSSAQSPWPAGLPVPRPVWPPQPTPLPGVKGPAHPDWPAAVPTHPWPGGGGPGLPLPGQVPHWPGRLPIPDPLPLQPAPLPTLRQLQFWRLPHGAELSLPAHVKLTPQLRRALAAALLGVPERSLP